MLHATFVALLFIVKNICGFNYERGEILSKIFKDFTFAGKKFSSLSAKYIPVNFENNNDISLAMERNMEMGEVLP